MNMARMRLLIAGWWCATVVPGLAVALFAGDASLDGTGGFLVLVWIGGYILQLFLFIAVSKPLKGVASSILLWFVVSLLPFFVDWSFGLNWWAEAASVLTAVAVAFYVDYNLTRAADLQRDGIRARATVLEVKKPLMNVVVNNVYIKRKLRIRVERDDGAPAYETTYSDLFMLGSVPDPGDSFRVVVDPGRLRHLAAADDAHQAATAVPDPAGPTSGRASWRFTSWRNPGGSSTPRRAHPASAPARQAPASYQPYQPGPAAPSVRDVVGSIRELADLHERGQLTDAEFAQAKQELLGAEDSAPPE